MGSGKVLTDEDFKGGKEPEDTSKGPADRSIPADEKIEVKGKEEPAKELEPSEKEKEEPQPEPSEDKKYKYASMDEFDRAYKEAERKMHEATTEKARLARELEEVRKPKDQPKTLQDRIDEMTDQILEKIKILPNESPTRDRDAARLWARNQSDIDDLKYEERRKRDDSERSTVKRIYDTANKEGLKTDEELDYFAYRYSKTDSSLSIEERTSQAVEATKSGLGKLREGLVKDVEKDKKDKDDLKVLGRGSSRTGKSSEEKTEKPLTMSQQIAEMQEKRRLKKDDL
jgi:hypothetical protein